MSTSFLGFDLRTSLPVASGTFYSLSLATAIYAFVQPADGAKRFGLILPESQPTPTEKAFTKIFAVRNLSTAALGIGMIAYLQLSDTCTKLPTGPFAAAAIRQVLGYSMLVGSVVSFWDGYVLQQFSDHEGLSDEAVEVAKRQRGGHALWGIPIGLMGVGWIYA